MAKRKERPRETPLDLIRRAVEESGHEYTDEQHGPNTVLTIQVAPDTRTVAVFGPDGNPVPPPGVRELIERAMRAQDKAREEPPQEPLESISYDHEKQGSCTDEGPCPGLQGLMGASCVLHGGIIGMTESDEATIPDLVGFVPTQDHRDGHMLVFNFCPCCGHDMRRDNPRVLGVDGPATLQ